MIFEEIFGPTDYLLHARKHMLSKIIEDVFKKLDKDEKFKTMSDIEKIHAINYNLRSELNRHLQEIDEEISLMEAEPKDNVFFLRER